MLLLLMFTLIRFDCLYFFARDHGRQWYNLRRVNGNRIVCRLQSYPVSRPGQSSTQAEAMHHLVSRRCCTTLGKLLAIQPAIYARLDVTVAAHASIR